MFNSLKERVEKLRNQEVKNKKEESSLKGDTSRFYRKPDRGEIITKIDKKVSGIPTNAFEGVSDEYISKFEGNSDVSKNINPNSAVGINMQRKSRNEQLENIVNTIFKDSENKGLINALIENNSMNIKIDEK